jgi:hypothetical protein
MKEKRQPQPRRHSVSRREGSLHRDMAVYAYNHRAENCGFRVTDYPAFVAWAGRVRDAIGVDYPKDYTKLLSAV